MKINSLYILSIFLLAAILSVIIGIPEDLNMIFKVLAVVLIGSLILMHYSIKSSAQSWGRSLAQGIILFNLSFFVLLLVIATGGFFSPLLITIYIVNLAFAILFSLPIALAFFSCSLLALSVIYFIGYTTNSVRQDPAFLIIQLLCAVGIILLSGFVSKKYHIKGEIADILFRELSTSEKEEGILLENIEEGVITLDKNYAIVKMNKASQDLTGINENEVKGASFFDVCKFYDKNKQIIPNESPLIKQPQTQEGFYIGRMNGTLLGINSKLSSLLKPDGTAEEYLFIFTKNKGNT